MQNNDFDKSLRDLLNNNPEPDYNPADWDRMEDMLHHAGAANPSPNQGAETAAGSNAAGAAQGILAGGKAWLLAAMVTLTGVNLAVLVTSNNPKETAVSEIAVQETPPQTAAQEKPASELSVANQATGNKKQKPENVAPQPEGQEAFSAGLQEQKYTPQPEASKNLNQNSRVKPGASATGSGTKSGNSGGEKMAANLSFGSSGSTRNSAGGGNSGNNSGGLVGNLPGQTGQEMVLPCHGNRQPYLPYLISGTDTVTAFTFTLKTCEPFCLTLPGLDADAGDQVKFSANLAQLPGAAFETNPENNAQASFCWTPNAAQARTAPYTLKVNLQNPNCPGYTTYTIVLQVQPSAAVRITGDSLLALGQQTRLRAQATGKEITYKWLPAVSLSGNLNTAEVLASPLQSTTYTLLATSASGCQTQTTHTIKVLRDPAAEVVFAPNIFTPNADGINDFFEVKGMVAGEMDLTVYNRSGKLVYSNSRYANDWNGGDLPGGIYTYVLRDTRTGKLLRGLVEINR